TEVHVDGPQGQVPRAGETQAKVRIPRHAQIPNLHIRRIRRLNGPPASPIPDIDGPAAVENLAAADADDVGPDGARSHNGDTLTRADGVKCRGDGGVVV